MRQAKVLIYIGVLSLLIIQRAGAQNISVQTNIDTTQIKIGEQLVLDVNLRLPNNYWVLIENDSTTWNPFEWIATQSDTSRIHDSLNIHHRFTLTTFDTGQLILPGLRFAVQSANGQLDSLFTQNYQIRVDYVEVDTTKAIRDINEPMQVGLTRWELITRVAIPLMFILLVVLIWYLWKNQKKTNKLLPDIIPPNIDPWDWALDQLQKLDKEKLWQNNQVKAFHFRLTTILRVYLERISGEPVLESTTSETLNLMKSYYSKEILEELKQILETADLAKFAKITPLPDQNARSMTNAILIIEQSKPHIEET